MVRLRRLSTTAQNRETVELRVVGPKSIIPTTVVMETYLSNTWLNFFVDELELDVPSNQGIFICNQQYCPSDPKEGKGWKCQLNEPISNYVNHFERHRNRYTVRICHPSDFAGKRGRVFRVNSQTPRARSSTPGPNGRKTENTPGNRVQRSRSVANVRSTATSPQGRQQSILISTTSTRNATANGTANLTGVLTPRSQQSHYGTRQKRLHDQSTSTLLLDTPTPPPEVPEAKRPRRSRKQTLVPRSQAPGPAVVKQEVAQAEDEVPQINDVRSIMKIELPPANSISGEFYDEDDELETDVSSADTEGDFGSDANGMEGREPAGQVEESGDQGEQEQEVTGGGGDEFGAMSDSSEVEEEPCWQRWADEEEEDGISMCTAVTQEEIQLRQEGIQVEDIKSVANGRFHNFSNAYMLRVKNEIKQLRKNNHWVKNVEKSPLACFFLQELFKE